MDINTSMKYSEEWSKKFNDCSIFLILQKYELDITNENKRCYKETSNKIMSKEE